MQLDKLSIGNSAISINNIVNTKSSDPDSSLITERYFLNNIIKKVKLDDSSTVVTTDAEQTLLNKVLDELRLMETSHGKEVQGLNAAMVNGQTAADIIKIVTHDHSDYLTKSEFNDTIDNINRSFNELNTKFKSIDLKLAELIDVNSINKLLDDVNAKLAELTLKVNVTNDSISSTDNVIGLIITTVTDKPPVGYLPCDGSSLRRDLYSTLYKKIGTKYGSDSDTTFNLPRLDDANLYYYIKF